MPLPSIKSVNYFTSAQSSSDNYGRSEINVTTPTTVEGDLVLVLGIRFWSSIEHMAVAFKGKTNYESVYIGPSGAGQYVSSCVYSAKHTPIFNPGGKSLTFYVDAGYLSYMVVVVENGFLHSPLQATRSNNNSVSSTKVKAVSIPRGSVANRLALVFGAISNTSNVLNSASLSQGAFTLHSSFAYPYAGHADMSHICFVGTLDVSNTASDVTGNFNFSLNGRSQISAVVLRGAEPPKLARIKVYNSDDSAMESGLFHVYDSPTGDKLGDAILGSKNDYYPPGDITVGAGEVVYPFPTDHTWDCFMVLKPSALDGGIVTNPITPVIEALP